MMKNKRTADSALLDPFQRSTEPTSGAIGVARMFAVKKSVNEAARTIDFVCSSEDVDRYGESITREALAAAAPGFIENGGAFPYGHSYEAANGQTPTVGRWVAMRMEGDKLIGTAYFKPRGLGEECWQDYRDGSLTSVSIAFIALAWDMRQREFNGAEVSVRTFTAIELLECSAVLIPANQAAKIRAAGFLPESVKSGGGDGVEARVYAAIESGLKKFLDVDQEGPLRDLILGARDSRGLLDHDGWGPGTGMYGDHGDTGGDVQPGGDDSEIRELLAAAIEARG